MPTAKLRRLEGKVDHISDDEPISFSARIKMDVGSNLSFSLPDWAGGNITAQLLEFAGNATIDSRHLESDGTVQLLGSLISSAGKFELNWHDGFVESRGSSRILGGLIETPTLRFRGDSRLNINLLTTATFGVPDAVPWIGGWDAISGNAFLEFSNDDAFNNDSAAAWTTVSTPFGRLPLGFRVWLNAGFSVLGGDEIDEIVSSVEGEAAASSQFDIPDDAQWSLFAAEWEQDATPELIVTTPSGATLTESDISSNPFVALVPELSSSTRRVIAIQDPEAGTWTVTLNEDAGLGAVVFRSLVNNDTPTIDLSATGGAMRSNVEITYNAVDPDSEARLALFYDTDNEGHDGLLIANGLSENDGAGNYSWDTTGLPEGVYHIYAMVDDGVNPPQYNYAESIVSITAAGIHGTTWSDLNGNGVLDDNDEPLTNVAVYLDVNANGQHDEDEPVTVSRSDDPATSESEAGRYGFIDVVDGDYRIRQVLPPGMETSFPVDNDGTHLIRISEANGRSISDLDFGSRPVLASIAGVVWHDTVVDGFRDPSTEAKLSGIEVRLLRASDQTQIGEMETDDSGSYRFQVMPGTYIVEFDTGSLAGFTLHDQLGTDDFDSDVDPQNSQAAAIDVVSGQTVEHIDAGLVGGGWQNPSNPLDVNRDGIVTPSDVLLIINRINANPNSSALPSFPNSPPPFYDVNGDGLVAPVDVLLVINALNSPARLAEGESLLGESAFVGSWPVTVGAQVTTPTSSLDARAAVPLRSSWAEPYYKHAQISAEHLESVRRWFTPPDGSDEDRNFLELEWIGGAIAEDVAALHSDAGEL